jgi:hypothetical protein
MTTIRKFVYAALLALTTLNVAPSLARAQEPVRGQFTLAHEVRWQNAVLPAGDYSFSFDPNGGAAKLFLSKVSGERRGFMLLVSNTGDAKPAGANQLVLEDTPAGSYVSELQLPEYGMTLHFRTPSQAGEKQVARAATTAAAGAQ